MNNRILDPALVLILTVTLMLDSLDPERLIWNALTREFYTCVGFMLQFVLNLHLSSNM